MSIKVLADSNGDFRLDIDTDGVPEGEFLITADGINKTAGWLDEIVKIFVYMTTYLCKGVFYN